MSTAPKLYYSPAEYLARERKALTKSEYYAGEIFAMAGGTPEHSLIAANLTGELRNVLKGGACNVFTSDLRVKVEATGLYTYPDVSVVCGERQYDDDRRDTLTNPTVLVEVLSPTTASYDRLSKSRHYRAIESLQELLLVAQDMPSIERCFRATDGSWSIADVYGLDQQLELTSLGVSIPMAEVYRGVTFPPTPPFEEPKRS